MTEEPPKPKRRRRLLIAAICAVALVVLLPLAALWLLACTEAGLRAIARNTGRFGDTTVDIREVHGTLVGGFTIASLDVQHPRAHVRLQQLRGRLALAPLLWRTISVPRFDAASLLVEVRSPRQRSTRRVTPMRFLPTGLTIRGDEVHIAAGTLVLVSGTRYDVTSIDAATMLNPRRIMVYRGDLQWENLAINATGEVRAASPIGLVGDMHFDYRAAGQPQWLANARISGDLDRMPVRGSVTAPLRTDFAGNGLDLDGNWRFTGDAQLHDLDITVFGGGGALGRISGELALILNRDGFGARGRVTPAGLKAGPMDVTFSGRYGARVLTIADASVMHPPSTAYATTRGTVTVTPEGPRLALHGEWQRFRWPLPARDPPVRSNAGTYTLNGVRPYGFTLHGDLLPADLPAMQMNAKGQLYTNRAVVDEAQLKVLDGTAQVSGEATWSPQDSWKLQGMVDALNPALLRPDLPGTLSFGFAAEGGEFAANAPLSVSLQDLRGRLRRQNASGSGKFTRTPDGWTLENIDLRVGAAHLTADGSLGAARDLRFSLAADDLSLLAADARGRVTATGRVTGSATEPVFTFKAQGSAFAYGAVSMRSLDADVDLDLRAAGPMRARLRARDLQYGTRTFNGVDLDVDGTAADHRAVINVQATKIGIALRAQGGYAQGTWHGSLNGLDFDDGAGLKLALAAPVDLSLSAAQQRVGELCLTGNDGRICAAGENAAAGWKARLEASNLPMRTLTAGLSQDIEYDGRLGIRAEASGQPAQPWVGTLAATLEGAQLRHRLTNGREERFALGTGKIDAQATPSVWSLRVGLDAAESGRIDAGLEAQRIGSDWRDYPVKGSLGLETDGLGLIDVYLAQVDRIAGRLTTQVTVSGTLGTPRLTGELKLAQGEVDLYQINLALREMALDARFNDTSLEFTGSTRAGDGSAKLTGSITWREREPYGELHIDGENLLVVNVPEARVQASPKLDFKIAAHRIDVGGEVKIPYARIEPADITNAVLPSADEVLVGAAARDPSKQFQVVSNILVSLGERVTVDTYGLTGRIGGSISVRTDEADVSRGSGELNVEEGKYTAFGRKLDVERGRLIFSNGPLTDPGIDIRAVKVFPDVTAGVNVRGTLRQPRMTFFSTPALPQSQIVSLVLAGGSLESVQNSSRQGAARTDMLAQGGAILAQQFGNRVGIEDVGIESDINNETSLVLGKYLSPRLYVSYGISLAEVINTIKLRYTINDHWTIKTESGKARSADLVFTIKK